MQARHLVMAARLPLNPMDRRVLPVVRDRLRDQAPQGLGVRSGEISEVTKPRPPASVTNHSGQGRTTATALRSSASVPSCSSYAASRPAIRSAPDTVAAAMPAGGLLHPTDLLFDAQPGESPARLCSPAGQAVVATISGAVSETWSPKPAIAARARRSSAPADPHEAFISFYEVKYCRRSCVCHVSDMVTRRY